MITIGQLTQEETHPPGSTVKCQAASDKVAACRAFSGRIGTGRTHADGLAPSVLSRTLADSARGAS